jgi:hypothetical protein
MDFSEVVEQIKDVFCGDIEDYGILDQTNGRGGETLLRRINSFNNFTPITYKGGNMIFAIASDTIEIDRHSNATVPVKLILIVNDWYVLGEVIKALDMKELQEVSIDTDSLAVYERYFTPSDDRPFSNYAFELSFNTNETILNKE